MTDSAEPQDVRDAWRTLGRQLAELRKAAGYTQHSFAPMTLYARSTVANAETGHQHPDRAFWQRCDLVLKTDGALTTDYDGIVALERHLRRAKSTIAAEAMPLTATRGSPSGAPGDYEAMRCHDLGSTSVPGLDGGTPAAELSVRSHADDHGIIADDAFMVTVMVEGREQVVQLSRRAVLGALSGAVAASVVDQGVAVVPRGGAVDAAVVDHFAALRGVLVESDNRMGAAAVLPTALHLLQQISQFRRAARVGVLREDLLCAEARWAEFAGWLSDDLGDRAAGDSWLAQALTMAQEAHDADFTMYVFARMAQRSAESTDRDRVLGLAHAALRSNGDQPRVRAFAALQRARGHALTQDVSGFRHAVDDARSLIPDSSAARGDLGSFCTQPYISAQEGEGWLRLGRPSTAVDCFDRALAGWPVSYPRDRGLYTARTAAAYAAAGDPEHAAVTATTALQYASVTRSARIKREVVALSQRLAPFRTQPAVAELYAALAAHGNAA